MHKLADTTLRDGLQPFYCVACRNPRRRQREIVINDPDRASAERLAAGLRANGADAIVIAVGSSVV